MFGEPCDLVAIRAALRRFNRLQSPTALYLGQRQFVAVAADPSVTSGWRAKPFHFDGLPIYRVDELDHFRIV